MWLLGLMVWRQAAEFGKYGITVNAYAPGLVETTMRQSFVNAHLCVYFLRILT